MMDKLENHSVMILELLEMVSQKLDGSYCEDMLLHVCRKQ